MFIWLDLEEKVVGKSDESKLMYMYESLLIAV